MKLLTTLTLMLGLSAAPAFAQDNAPDVTDSSVIQTVKDQVASRAANSSAPIMGGISLVQGAELRSVTVDDGSWMDVNGFSMTGTSTVGGVAVIQKADVTGVTVDDQSGLVVNQFHWDDGTAGIIYASQKAILRSVRVDDGSILQINTARVGR